MKIKTKDNKFKATFDGKKYILKPGSILNKDKPDEDYEGLSAQQACGKQQICGSYVINTNADKNGDYSVTFKEIPLFSSIITNQTGMCIRTCIVVTSKTDI